MCSNYEFGSVRELLKTIITTSRRPTRSSRRFVKILSLIIPDSMRVARGKYTINTLLLQALDLGVENIIVVRNRSGNPGYVDVYSVDSVTFRLNRVCSIRICGYKIIENYKRGVSYNKMVLLRDNLIKISLDEHTLACILKCFNISIVSSRSSCIGENTLEVRIKTLNKAYELSFNSCRGESRGLVLRICPIRTIMQK